MSLPPLDATFTIKGHAPKKVRDLVENEEKRPSSKNKSMSYRLNSLRVSWGKKEKSVSRNWNDIGKTSNFSACGEQAFYCSRALQTPSVDEMETFEKILKKLPEKVILDIFRNHFAKVGEHTRDEFFRRAIRWRRGTAASTDKHYCIICRMQRYASRPIQTEYENIISSMMLYPPHYYNKYSREEKKIEAPADKSCFPNLMQISKKLDLGFKASRTMNTPPPAPPVSVLESMPPLTPSLDSPYSDSNTEQAMYMYQAPKRRPVHNQCKPLSPIFMQGSEKISAELSEIYRRRALKGSFKPKQFIDTEDEESRPEYHVTYPIASLGVKVNIPAYNRKLHPIPPYPSRIQVEPASRDQTPPKGHELRSTNACMEQKLSAS